MINQQLLTYIQKQQEAGTDDAKIKENLRSVGWREDDIDEGFQAVENNLTGDGSPAQHQQIREQAAQKRSEPGDGGAAADSTSQVADNDKQVDQTEDAYREDVSTADQASDADDSSLSPIDESAGPGAAAGEVNKNSDSDSDKEDGPADTAEEPTDSTSADETEPTMSTTDEADGAKSPEDIVDAGKSLENLKDSEPAESSDAEPQAVRTFHTDRKQLGVEKSPANVSTTGPKDAETSSGQTASVSAASAAASQSTDDRSSKSKHKQAKKESGAGASMAGVNESGSQSSNETEDERKQREEYEKRERRARQEEDALNEGRRGETMAGTLAATQSGDDSRQTADGRQRFSAGSDSATAKKRAAARQKKRKKQRGSTGSGSNVMSIVIFIVALLLVGGGGAYAYFTYFQTDVPQTTAADVMESLAAAENFDFRTTIESASTDGETQTMIIEGVVDLSTDSETQSYYTVATDQAEQSPMTAVMAEVENIGTVPQQQLTTIEDVLLTPEFFSIGEFQTKEQLGQTNNSNGFTTNRFSASVNPQQFVSDYATLHQALFNKPLSGEVLTQLQENVGGFSPTQGQAWIDPESGAPYQITFFGTGPDGQDMQVNFQFKNHGAEIESTPPYEVRSFEQTLSQYFSAQSDPDQVATTTPSTNEDQDDTSTTTDSDQTTEEGPSQAEIAAAQARRNDRLRINDINQLSVALRVYANENGMFPASLASLQDSETTVLDYIPRDPATDARYLYSVSSDGDRFHLGVPLRALSRGQLQDDANYNSRGQGFPAGFNGATENCNEANVTEATTCYDITASVE